MENGRPRKSMTVLIRLHTLVVRLYPAGFRDEFGAEMTSVFAESVADTKQRGLLALCLRELFDLPASLWQEYRHRFDDDRRTIMNQVSDVKHTGDSDHAGPTTPASWARTLGAILPFVLFGLMLTLKGINYHASSPRPWVGIYRDLIVHTALLIALGIGWATDFPRWVDAYLGVTLMWSMSMSNTVTDGLELFGYTFGRELWGWRAWIPLLALSIVMLLLTRSLRPLARLFRAIWRDWTRLSFGLYGALTWLLLGVTYDGKSWYNNTVYLPVNMFLLTLVIVGGAFFYMRCQRPWRRAMALQLALVLYLAVSASVVALDGRVEYGTSGGIVIFVVFMLAIMFVPGVPSLVGQRIRSIRSG